MYCMVSSRCFGYGEDDGVKMVPMCDSINHFCVSIKKILVTDVHKPLEKTVFIT